MALAVLSFGGGVNSTGLLAGLFERATPPDAILFADTKAEFEDTYLHVEEVSAWSVAKGGPPITRNDRNTPLHASLEEECRNNDTLPSLAFGYKGCSVKWKRQPMDRWVKAWEPAKAAWARGERVARLMGIDAGESHRGKVADDDLFTYRRPLVEWDWDRADCIAAIGRAGLRVPRKSACFFCPASKKVEVLALAKDRPDLFARAVAMERHARDTGGLKFISGLGRHWSWEGLAAGQKYPETVEPPCECYDGGGETR